MALLPLHVRRANWMFLLHVHASCPCCMYMLHAHDACPCCISMLHVLATWLWFMLMLPMLHVHAWFHAACPCCIPLLHVHVACPCYMSTLHVQNAACPHCPSCCPCCTSMLKNMLQEHVACPSRIPLMYMLYVCQGSFRSISENGTKIDLARRAQYNLLNMWVTDRTWCSPCYLITISVKDPWRFSGSAKPMGMLNTSVQAWPGCMSIQHGHAVCPVCLFMLHEYGTLHYHAAWTWT